MHLSADFRTRITAVLEHSPAEVVPLPEHFISQWANATMRGELVRSHVLTQTQQQQLDRCFAELMQTDPDFRAAVEASTQARKRFRSGVIPPHNESDESLPPSR